jgi:hypothetical protein
MHVPSDRYAETNNPHREHPPHFIDFMAQKQRVNNTAETMEARTLMIKGTDAAECSLIE